MDKGDANTNIFPQFVDARRITNTIWEIQNGMGEIIIEKNLLEREDLLYYKNFY